LRFMINNDLALDEFKKASSWEEKSRKLIKKRARILLSTLIQTLTPNSIDNLASVLGYRSRERYRDDYVKPLKDSLLIEYTLAQANDPNQKYKITSRARGSPI
jgi:ATP-dependent DNA helicase RecG